VPIAVEVRRHGCPPRRDYATNVSPGGLCLHLREPLPAGEPVALAFELPGEPGRIEVRGRVTWSEQVDPAASPRFFEAGVRIEVVGEAERERIVRFVRLCEPEEPRPA
jgi:uncharacterized protein (TIGR02266 family)